MTVLERRQRRQQERMEFVETVVRLRRVAAAEHKLQLERYANSSGVSGLGPGTTAAHAAANLKASDLVCEAAVALTHLPAAVDTTPAHSPEQQPQLESQSSLPAQSTLPESITAATTAHDAPLSERMHASGGGRKHPHTQQREEEGDTHHARLSSEPTRLEQSSAQPALSPALPQLSPNLRQAAEAQLAAELAELGNGFRCSWKNMPQCLRISQICLERNARAAFGRSIVQTGNESIRGRLYISTRWLCFVPQYTEWPVSHNMALWLPLFVLLPSAESELVDHNYCSVTFTVESLGWVVGLGGGGEWTKRGKESSRESSRGERPTFQREFEREDGRQRKQWREEATQRGGGEGWNRGVEMLVAPSAVVERSLDILFVLCVFSSTLTHFTHATRA
jgi:hypothetical protein